MGVTSIHQHSPAKIRTNRGAPGIDPANMEVLSCFVIKVGIDPLEIGPFQTLDSLDGVDHGLLGVVVFAMLYIYKG